VLKKDLKRKLKSLDTKILKILESFFVPLHIPYELLVLEETITKMDKSFNMFLKMVGIKNNNDHIYFFSSLMLLEWAIEKKCKGDLYRSNDDHRCCLRSTFDELCLSHPKSLERKKARALKSTHFCC
jgi:hypothetical protein